MATYWKSPRYQIQPPERLTPIVLLDSRIAVHDYIREYEAGPLIVLGPEHGLLHHLSYCGPDERVERKLSTWSHKNEVAFDWYRRVWQGWDANPLMRDLHPTHPTFFGCAERIEIPSVLKGVWDPRPVAAEPPMPARRRTLSIVVPVFGGPEDIDNCLASLARCEDLLDEIVVVDDASPDDALKVVRRWLAKLPKLKLIRNAANLGFPASCNRGYAETSGDDVLFLNSDTRVPRAGLIRLIECLNSSGSIGAAGPLTNNAGYYQRIQPTYTDIGRLELFAQDFASESRDTEDWDVDMLVGFALAVKRSVIEELGGTPFDERYGKGLYEDNDMCMRIALAGYRCRVASLAFVHHEGSKSLQRMDEHPQVRLRKSRDEFHAKWKPMVLSGFASHLAGEGAGPIVFRQDRHPDRLRKELLKLKKRANISCCIIAKNEERVIGDCLDSVMDVFDQVIVLDTGSTDRTKEIALAKGAEVYDSPWTNSFSEARNECLKYAKGKWIFVLDCDDTLPHETALAVLHSAINAPPDVTAFVVPVQFVGDGPAGGTRVDHVKLFLNLKGVVRYQFRIHEQIIGSLRQVGGRFGTIDQCVMHSGYDQSVEGQKRKRERDWPLLLLDLEENPEHPFVLFNCGMTCFFEGRFKEAIEYFERCIAVSKVDESFLRKAYVLYGNSFRQSGDESKALEIYLSGLQAVMEDPELRFEAAKSLEALGRLEEARDMYLAVAPLQGNHFTSMDISIKGYKRSVRLGMLYHRMGDFGGARKWLRQAIDEAPYHLDSALVLFDFAMEAGDLREALAVTEIVKSIAGPVEMWVNLRLKIAEVTGEPTFDLIVRLHRENPGAHGPAILLSRELIAIGDLRQAIPLVEALAAGGCPESLFNLSKFAIARGDLEAARRHVLHATQLDPTYEPAQRQLAGLEAMLAEAVVGGEG